MERPPCLEMVKFLFFNLNLKLEPKKIQLPCEIMCCQKNKLLFFVKNEDHLSHQDYFFTTSTKPSELGGNIGSSSKHLQHLSSTRQQHPEERRNMAKETHNIISQLVVGRNARLHKCKRSTKVFPFIREKSFSSALLPFRSWSL